MCGRYHVDETTAKGIEEVIRQLNGGRLEEGERGALRFPAGDIHPTELAPVIAKEQGAVRCVLLRWGFPGYVPKGSKRKENIIFNARSESALEKPTFREGIQKRRIVIPASWFYEWNQAKEKNTFYRSDSPVLFMAGCFNSYEDGDRFVILTTAANASMEPVHDRMPLILEREELADWILDDGKAESLLGKTPGRLERRAEYEQLTLFHTDTAFTP